MKIKEVPYQEKYKVFVYCTFKKGYHNHNSRMKGAKFISNAKTVKGYSLYTNHDLWAFMIKDITGEGVIGELYEVDRATLERMYDRKCDLNNRFWLEEVIIKGIDIYGDDPVYAFFHTLPKSHAKKVESGEYTDTTLKVNNKLHY